MFQNRTGRAALVVCLLSPIAGCAEAMREAASLDAAATPMSVQNKSAAPTFADGITLAGGEGKPLEVRFATLDRKIIYNATVELVVEDFSGMPDRVLALVKKYEAYVASSGLGGSTGENRRGSWTIRVPVTRFDEFIAATKGLGELLNVATRSQDVSEEYYDVEARIRNKTKEEERLLKLLEERPGKLEDVIAIERELSRVREELERMQGRMRVLADQTMLTTVELSVVEIRDYAPPESPTLATRARRAFEGSLGALASAGEGLLIGAAALTPWLPLGAVVAMPVYLLLRQSRRQRAKRPSAGSDVQK